MNLNDLTLGEVKELKAMFSGDCGITALAPHPYEKGKAYFIRTVTHYYTGRLVAVYKNELVMDECAWIADTGRFSDFIKSGKLNEVEPMGDKVIIPRSAIIDAIEWQHKLPLEVK